MSIASELSALNGYILGAYDEINDKGGTVPANKNMANLASAISSISSGTPTTITPLNVTENGTYTAPTGTAYSPVTVNVSGGGGEVDISGLFGFTKAVSGTFSVSSASYQEYTLTHNLGILPKLVIFACDEVEKGSARYIIGGFVLQTGTMLSTKLMSSGIHIGGGAVLGRTQDTDSFSTAGGWCNTATAEAHSSNVYDLYGGSSGSNATTYQTTSTSARLVAKRGTYSCYFAPDKAYHYLVAG